MDWADGPLKVMPWWSSFSASGLQGDATKATAEKGVARLVDPKLRVPAGAATGHTAACVRA